MHLAEPIEEGLQERHERVQAPVEAASTEPVAEVGRPGEQVQGRLEVASEDSKLPPKKRAATKAEVAIPASVTLRCELSQWRRAWSQTPEGQYVVMIAVSMKPSD
jgi:hypothetical protein